MSSLASSCVALDDARRFEITGVVYVRSATLICCSREQLDVRGRAPAALPDGATVFQILHSHRVIVTALVRSEREVAVGERLFELLPRLDIHEGCLTHSSISR